MLTTGQRHGPVFGGDLYLHGSGGPMETAADYDEPYYYSAQTSALNISPDDMGDTGTVLINVLPGARAGDVPQITTIPANHYVPLNVTARTGAPGSASTVDAVREHGTNVIDVTGSIPVGAAAFASRRPWTSRPALRPTSFARRWPDTGLGYCHGPPGSQRPSPQHTPSPCIGRSR